MNAEIPAESTREWWFNGYRHRADGPAVERADGTREWWSNNLRHRADGPAVERADGTREWWVRGFRHRADGPAVERADGPAGPLVFEQSNTYGWVSIDRDHVSAGTEE